MKKFMWTRQGRRLRHTGDLCHALRRSRKQPVRQATVRNGRIQRLAKTGDIRSGRCSIKARCTDAVLKPSSRVFNSIDFRDRTVVSSVAETLNTRLWVYFDSIAGWRSLAVGPCCCRDWTRRTHLGGADLTTKLYCLAGRA